MGLFDKAKAQILKEQQQKDLEESILIATTDYIPNRQYEIIGLVTATIGKQNTDYAYIAEEIKKEAVKLNADAVIGFRASLYHNTLNIISHSAYGTAIRFTDKTED